MCSNHRAAPGATSRTLVRKVCLSTSLCAFAWSAFKRTRSVSSQISSRHCLAMRGVSSTPAPTPTASCNGCR
eukprot:6127935-Pyramimonas_sp.AAC.1